MKILSRVAHLLLITVLLCGQAVAQGKLLSLPNRPDALVNSLYEQVVNRHPLGVPFGADRKIFAPYLSKTLLHRFDLNNACFADWHRHNPDPNLKPPLGIFESGIFSGGDEKAEPKSFHIERTEQGRGGSSHVYVKLIWESPSKKPLIWHVAAVVIPENGRLVVDDVLYLDVAKSGVDSRLSAGLTLYCKGAHWVGNVSHPR